MYYLTNHAGRFIAARADLNTFLITFWEGSTARGVSGKQELACESALEAWEQLCAHVAEARSNGYSPEPIAHSPVDLDAAEAIIDQFALRSRGVYVQVESCTAEQFEKGLAHLENVVRALLDAGHNLAFRMTGQRFELASNSSSICIGIASEREWETISQKARDIFEERSFIDSTQLLPSGKGLWRFLTQESILDVCVRAFLGELKVAGAVFSMTSDADYSFDPLRPFQRQAIQEMDWYRNSPAVIKVLEDAGLVGGIKRKLVVPTDVGMSLFI